MLFITHDIDEALLLGDRLAIMTAGPEAMIKKTLKASLPRPRQVSMELLRLRREALGAIEEEVMRSMRQVSHVASTSG